MVRDISSFRAGSLRLFLCFQFEYQQAQLEAEIENLSWKIEHAETTDRGDLENQMDVAEKRRFSMKIGCYHQFYVSGQVS